MISAPEAQKLVAEHGLEPREEEIFLAASLGRVSARDVTAPIPQPVFDYSAIDGYGLRALDTSAASSERPAVLKLKGTVKTGDRKSPPLERGCVCRIMTGCIIPDGVDAVAAKEHTEIDGDRLIVRAPVARGLNVHYRGQEIKKGQTVLRKGALIQPGTVGFLSAMGIGRIIVYQAPRVSLISTGNELAPSGRPLSEGRIFDSNTPMIAAALEDMRIRPVFTRRLSEQPALIKKVIRFAVKESDIVVLMGGVSGGGFSRVKKVLTEEGVKIVFSRSSQKPGKSLYFGKKEGHLIFGLPANTANAFTCFYEYVYPAIRRAMGYAEEALTSGLVRLPEPLH